MSPQDGVSRRGFMKGIAGTAAAPGALGVMTVGTAGDASPEVSVAATVVRVSHSRTRRQALRIGVRASIQGPELDLDNVVLVIEDVPFTASAEDIRARIVQAVQTKVAAILERRGMQTSRAAAVQVFGGVLG